MKAVKFDVEEFYPVYVPTDDDTLFDIETSLPDDVLKRIKKLHSDWLTCQEILRLIGDRSIKTVDMELWQELEIETNDHKEA